jgi:hypothetical protein
MGEVDARKAHLSRGYPSMFTYCLGDLRMERGIIYNRIYAARTSRRFPGILGLIESGSISLTAIRILAPHMTEPNHVGLLKAAQDRTKEELEALVSERFARRRRSDQTRVPPPAGRHDSRGVTATSRPPGSPRSGSAAPAHEDEGGAPVTAEGQDGMTPLSPGRCRLRVTVTDETAARFRRLEKLLGGRSPNGNLSRILELALSALEEKIDEERAGIRGGRKGPARARAERGSGVSTAGASVATATSAPTRKVVKDARPKVVGRSHAIRRGSPRRIVAARDVKGAGGAARVSRRYEGGRLAPEQVRARARENHPRRMATRTEVTRTGVGGNRDG